MVRLNLIFKALIKNFYGTGTEGRNNSVINETVTVEGEGYRKVFLDRIKLDRMMSIV